MTKLYELNYHPAAENDLYDIFILIENYAGNAVAMRKLGEIERITKSLADFPYKGSIRDDLPDGLRAIPAADKAVICFSIDEDERSVLIMGVGYAGSDWVARVKERRAP